MIRSILAVAVVCTFACAATALHAADADAKKMASKDTKFIRNAAAGGQMEVDLGNLAKDKASSDDVKKFGQQMVDDHSKANDELKTLASSKNVDLTKAMDAGMKKTEAAKKKLEAKNGADFDKAYMDDMVKDHEKDVKEFEEASKSADDADLKAWAAKTLPTLQHHLEMAKDIQGKLGKS
jgi:putative membrane protein